MSSTLNRLRRLHGLGKKTTSSKAASATTDSDLNSRSATASSSFSPSRQQRNTERTDNVDAIGGSSAPLEIAVPGVELNNECGVCYATAKAVPLDQIKQGASLAQLLHFAVDHLHPFNSNFNLVGDADFRTAAFVDTETTGLGIGAGVYCFMVGVGRFEYLPEIGELSQENLWYQYGEKAGGSTWDTETPTHFVVRQLFMRRPAEECSLLYALAELLGRVSVTVTFNGRTFDLPMLRTRFKQNRQLLPDAYQQIAVLREDRAHLDLLIPARRLWRRSLESCRLIELERQILEQQRTSEDVPGHMIPLLYSQYVSNSGSGAGSMPGIFYHNLEDITSMVGLTTRIYTLFGLLERDASKSTSVWESVDGLELLSIGCCYEAIGHSDKAELAFRQALELLGSGKRALNARIEGYRRLGYLYKQRQAWEDATAIWQQWITIDDNNDCTPYIELAKYCEWQVTDLEQAEMWTRWALHNIDSSPQLRGKSISQMDALNHRLLRLRRKQAY